MGGRASRNKGCSFERLIAAAIVKAAGKGFTKKDCYRTPMSGGHPYAGESDLILSKPLIKIFPFCVECKHYKTFQPKHFFKSNQAIVNWMNQVSVSSSKDKFKRSPLLVMRGNNTEIYAAFTVEGLQKWNMRLHRDSIPGVILVHQFENEKRVWKIVVWNEVLKSISRAGRLQRNKV